MPENEKSEEELRAMSDALYKELQGHMRRIAEILVNPHAETGDTPEMTKVIERNVELVKRIVEMKIVEVTKMVSQAMDMAEMLSAIFGDDSTERDA